MNGFGFKIFLGWLLTCLVACSGCKQETADQSTPSTAPPPATASSQPEFQSGLTGEAILRDLVARYATAKSYRDNAVLYLSYELQGRSIQEPQRWSTTWDADGRLAIQIFNGNVRCNDGLLSCYVYDIESANIDNQHLLIPYDRQMPINQLFRDSIAKHFLGGYSELPLDETDMVAAPKLIPPTLSLLTNQARNGWLQNPTKVVRLPDETIEEKTCFVVRSLSQGMTSDIWIDQESFALAQISLPLKLLAGEVITSPEITDVVLMAKFHDAVFDEPIQDSEFAMKPREDSTPVLKYVALPENLPSAMIGQTAPDFQLIDRNQKSVGKQAFDGKVTTLLWLAGTSSFEAMKQLDTLAQKMDREQFNFAAVYSDSELKSPNVSSLVIDELAAAINATSLPAYYDPSLAASSALQVKTIPSLIVLDKNSKIQFAKSLSDQNWLDDVQAAAERVAEGDDVAAEMQLEYQRFLDSYHQQLVTVSASGLIGLPQVSPQPSTPNLVRNAGSNIRLRPEKTWTNSDFQQPGNIAILPIESRHSNRANFLIFDGWRTVVELDETGNTLNRNELKLPPEAAANLIRVGFDAKQKPLYVVFSTLGDKLFLFDEQWQPAGVYPKELTHKGIRDCQLTDLNGDGVSELVVAFDDAHGIHLVDTQSLAGEKISGLLATSLAQLGDDVVVTGDGKIGLLKTELTNVEETELSFCRVATLGNDLMCGLGMTHNGRWNAVGFDSQLKRSWTLSIGSQFFETEIEPVSVAQSSNGEFIWAIADTEDAIHLVSSGGKWLGDFQSESRLGGVAVANQDGRLCLIVSNKTGIECWDLNLTASPMRPASMRK